MYASVSPPTHLYGEIVSHVLPHGHSAQKGHFSSSFWRRIPIDEPPGGIERTDEPETSEEQEEEQYNTARGCKNDT